MATLCPLVSDARHTILPEFLLPHVKCEQEREMFLLPVTCAAGQKLEVSLGLL